MIGRFVFAFFAMLLLVGDLFAQETERSLNFTTKRDTSTLIEWGIGVVFLIGCLVVAFKPAKRSNLK